MRNRNATRDKILHAASRLFYDAGIRAVGVNAIADKAGVTKKTLYYHFKSKDDLIAGYLEMRDRPNLRAFASWYDKTEGPLEERIRAVFAHLAQAARNPRWRGCGFLRTAAELANLPGHPARKMASAHKKNLEQWLCGVIEDAERANAERLARQIALLIDGAFSSMLVHRDAAYIECAGDAAAKLIRESRSPKGQAP